MSQPIDDHEITDAAPEGAEPREPRRTGDAEPPAEEPRAEQEPRGPAAEPEPPAAPAAPAGESLEALRDRWLRAEAELQNYRRRAQRDLEETRRRAEESVMLEIIAAIDDLERALDAAAGDAGGAAWADGVRLVAQRLREYLARQGVTVVEPAGEAFDPAFHEALLEVPAPEGTPAGRVLQVVLKGYRRGERALRAARVVVAGHAAGRE